MEFLKDVLGDELYNQVAEKLKGNEKIKLANLADGGYVGKEKFDAAETTIADLKKQLADRDKDIAALKKSAGDNEALTKQFSDLQAKYKEDTEALNARLKDNALNAALDLSITKARGKNAKAIKALLDTSKLSLKDDGTVEGLEAALDALKKSDSYLFEQVETKPEGNGFHSGAPNPDTPDAKAVADAFAAARGNSSFTV
jgi:hypothetical protein